MPTPRTPATRSRRGTLLKPGDQIQSLAGRPEYGGRGREWHPKFLEYAQKLVHHPSYRGIPGGIVEDNKIRWNAPSHRPPGTRWSNLHDERLKWWREKARELSMPQEGDWISKVAKAIHPSNKKPCQTCGTEMSLLYEYPTQRTIDRVSQIEGLTVPFEYRDFQSILEIVPHVLEQAGEAGLRQLAEILRVTASVPRTVEDFCRYLEREYIPSEPRGILSPGAMSNAPDRLDGFHSYNLCCRSTEDTGRRRENLETYQDDRRAFELWSEGDWAAANYVKNLRVRGVCARCKQVDDLEADHIGPLSLGFQHRPRFHGLCGRCNSAKNNRMSSDDVSTLLADESKGATVISWHARAIWDLYKDKVVSDSDALALSKLMRVNQHHYMKVLWEIYEHGNVDFLRALQHPEYADNAYDIEGFTGTDFTFKRLVSVRRAATYSQSKRERSERIAFEALRFYNTKPKRNVRLIRTPDVDQAHRKVFDALEEKDYPAARRALEGYMEAVAAALTKKAVPRAHWGAQGALS